MGRCFGRNTGCCAVRSPTCSMTWLVRTTSKLAPSNEAVVVDVDRGYVAAQVRVRAKVVRDAARTGADLQHAHGLKALRKTEQTLDLHRFLIARRQVEHGVGLALLGLRVHANAPCSASFGSMRAGG